VKRWTTASEIVDACQSLMEKISKLQFKIINEISGCIKPTVLYETFKQNPSSEGLLIIIHNRLGLEII
jgi:hypothetical protein